MIIHEIRFPKPHYSIPQRIQHIRDVIQGRKTPPTIGSEKTYGVNCMPKLDFAKWIEQDVKKRFPKTSLCTMAALPYLPGHIPEPLYRVAEIQEIHWLAPMDTHFNEPRCIQVAKIRGIEGSNMVPMCPSQLRPLTPEEYTLVNSLNPRSARPVNSGSVSDPEKQAEQSLDPAIDNGDYAG